MTVDDVGSERGEVGKVEARLRESGVRLQPVPAPLAAYTPALTAGRLVWTSGQLPLVDGKLATTGHVGGEVDLEAAQQCARLAAMNAIAAVKSEIGDLNRVERVVKVVVFVSSAPDFTDQALVANGASTLIEAVFGTCGKHARSAVGVAVLPLNAPVEIEMVVSIS